VNDWGFFAVRNGESSAHLAHEFGGGVDWHEIGAVRVPKLVEAAARDVLR